MTDKTKPQEDKQHEGIDLSQDSPRSAAVDEAEAGKTSERVEAENLRARLEETERELAEFKDKYLRLLAENENTRKRMRQQAEENLRIERERLLRELLPVVDNLERTVAAARGGGNGKPIVEGAEMVLRSMMDLLHAFGVTRINTKGERFDPALHEALDHIESVGHEPDTVVNEHYSGYKIGERVLRPARVTVAKATRAQDSDAEGQDMARGHSGRRRAEREDDDGEQSA